MGTMYTTRFNHHKMCIFLSEFVFLTVLNIDTSQFPDQDCKLHTL